MNALEDSFKHRSIVDLQQTLNYVRFTKIQHTLKRWTIYEDST